MLYVFELPEQIVALPVMDPGVAGTVLTVTANDCPADVPQVLLALTETFPLVVLAEAVMELDVEEPVQPPGNVQV